MIRGLKTEEVKDFVGLNTLDDPENLPPSVFFDANNVIVGPSGSATALRSPRAWTPTFSDSIVSAFYWKRNAGDLIIVDLLNGIKTETLTTDGTTNTSRRTNQTTPIPYRWKRLNINDKAYGINGAEFVQMEPSGFVTYKVGIDFPTVAPTATPQAGGTLAIVTGVTASYAYYNGTTGHVSRPSVASGSSGAIGGGNGTLRVAVTASAQTGVTKIVLFVTADAGTVRYLVVDSNGVPVYYNNTTGNIDITAPYNIDTNTPETTSNYRPPDTATFMFEWKDRIFLCGFTGATTRQTLIYSASETVYIGVPYESYPYDSGNGIWRNLINIPAKTETAVGGVGTDMGALILSDRNAYLLSGDPTDKVSGPQNPVTISEKLDSLNWGIGTLSPLTIQATPFGVIWLDQNRRIQLWPYSGLPIEIGLPLRSSLATLSPLATSLSIAEAAWFQGGEVTYYVLGGSTTFIAPNILDVRCFIGIYTDPATYERKFTYGISSHPCATIITAIDSNVLTRVPRCLVGTNNYNSSGVNKLYSILDLDTAGAGWATADAPYFAIMTGNNAGNYSALASLRFDSTAGRDISVIASAPRSATGTSSAEVGQESLDLRQEEQCWFARVNRYGVRHKLKFLFPVDDSLRRDIINLRLDYSGKKRRI